MKKILVIAFSLLIYSSFAQESFKKKFYIREYIPLKGNDTIFLVKDIKTKFLTLPQEKQDSILNLFQDREYVKYTVEKQMFGNKVLVEETVPVQKFVEQYYEVKPEKANIECGTLGFVKFENNKLTVNSFLRKNEHGKYKREKILYYKFEDRQSMKLAFKEWNVSGLTIPLKYRFKSQDVSPEFSSSVDLNLFVGRTIFGRTNFFHRAKVGNISNSYKLSGGVFVGASTYKLNNSNTSSHEEPIPKGEEITEGLASIGLGTSFSFNKINLGLFYGCDFGVGNNSKKWNYNKKPWLGVAVGYSLLDF